MKPLIDADILAYEIGSIGEDEAGKKSFEFVAAVLDGRIEDICKAVESTEPPTLYLTGSGNFRENIAVTKPYKGNRVNEKPWHYKNIVSYMKLKYNTVVVEGMEADDAMSIRQSSEGGTVICSRDKDLRQVPGWHYGWECGKQFEFSLKETDELGYIELSEKKKIIGMGYLFFASQLLTGDSTDNIPGCKGVGPVAAYNLLDGCTSPPEAIERVRSLYEEKGHDEEYFLEQAYLLWMVRELDEEGRPVMWEPPS